MWNSRFKGMNPSIAGAAGAAVLCTVFTEHISSRSYEIGSETLCWILLPILFKIAELLEFSTLNSASLSSKLSHQESQPACSKSLWIVAGGVAIACSQKSEIGFIILFPALTPLILMYEKALAQQYNLQPLRTLERGFFSFPATILGSSLVALFAIFAVSQWDLIHFAMSIIPLLGLLIVYISFIPKDIERPHNLNVINIEEDIFRLSLRIVFILSIILAIQVAAFGLSDNDIIPTFSMGLAKALSWFFIIQTTRSTSWCVATAIQTFGIIASCDSAMQSSDIRALSQVIAAFLVLGQVIHLLPKQSKAKSALWILILASLVPYLGNVFAIRNAQSGVLTFAHFQEHPVEVLIRNAKSSFEHRLQTQSKDYVSAHQEYRRRYNREPPPGFKAWYEFAVAHKSPIIDEFDMIFDMISPFWQLSGKQFVEISDVAYNVSNVDLWLCTFTGDSAETYCRHPTRSFDRNVALLFNDLLGNVRSTIPNLKFLVNHLDEPRVLIPQRSLSKRAYDTDQIIFTPLSRQQAWETVTESCALQSNSIAHGEVETFGLPFVTNRTLAMDLCRHPEYSSMHGLLMSPTSFIPIEGLIPVLSTGSLSTMGDILFPSSAYTESRFRYDEASDLEWDKKQNNLYWAGSNTGGYASNIQWKQFHRQKFVSLAQNLERKPHSYVRERDGVVVSEKSSFLNGRLFDVAFTRIFQCERKYCRHQRLFFHTKPWANKDRAFRSRLVFDIDGNGISGRFYKLLGSRSLPLKQTLLREWHDERLVPWVHYVPVSQSMDELPELVFYLTSTEDGQRRAKEVAEQGREWFTRAFRDVDMSIYTYRILLELARLQDPERLAS